MIHSAVIVADYLCYYVIPYYAIYGITQAHKHEQLKYIKNTSKIQLC